MTTTWTAAPQDVERLIGAVLPHTSTDDYIPVITCVRLEVTSDRLIAVGTDRYTLGVAWGNLADWNEDNPTHQDAAACIFANDLRRLFAFLKPHKKKAASWTLTDKGLTVAIGEESLTVRTVDVDFVKWRPLIGRLSEESNSSTGTPVMRFTPQMVSHFIQSAKAMGEGFGQMHWHFGQSSTSAPLIRIGDNFIGLLMPQRLDGDRPQLDLSAIGIESPKAVAA